MPEVDIPAERDLEAISEGEETKCSDDIWDYYEAHKDEAISLEDYARKRGIKI
ncbi:MAG: hypothetical protein AB9879_01715 [Methanothrix sp.]